MILSELQISLRLSQDTNTISLYIFHISCETYLTRLYQKSIVQVANIFGKNQFENTPTGTNGRLFFFSIEPEILVSLCL